MVREVVEGLAVKPGGRYVDGTLGSAGHAAAILACAGDRGVLLGIDRDGEALERARARLGGAAARCRFAPANFARIAEVARATGFSPADGVVLDLGVSSEQLDTAERGFSFMRDGPLDMRMDATVGESAADLVNRLPEEELARVLREWGEEPRARRIAAAIARERRAGAIRRTGQLAQLVCACIGRPPGARVHPATRTFQALRIAVNRELESLQEGLEAGLSILAPGGRLAVIAYHSLEDRIAKQCFAAHVFRREALAAGGWEWRGRPPALAWVTRKPLTPADDEVRRNPRARSAKLRIVERIDEPAPDAGRERR